MEMNKEALFWKEQAQIYKEYIDEIVRFPEGRIKAVNEVIEVAEKLKQIGLFEQYKPILLSYLGIDEKAPRR
jgi:hypothetical protein